MSQPEILRGSIDDLYRPFIKLQAAGFDEPLTAFLDTAFNGSLIVDEYQARRLGFEVTKKYPVSAVLASQQAQTFFLCRGRFPWFGEELFISAFMISETEQQRRERRRRKTDQEIVVGVELLLGCRLEIDFPARSVVITKVA